MTELGWRPRFTDIDAIVASAWRWRRRYPRGYADSATGM
jgi:UDP-glucose 4-epimerase